MRNLKAAMRMREAANNGKYAEGAYAEAFRVVRTVLKQACGFYRDGREAKSGAVDMLWRAVNSLAATTPEAYLRAWRAGRDVGLTHEAEAMVEAAVEEFAAPEATTYTAMAKARTAAFKAVNAVLYREKQAAGRELFASAYDEWEAPSAVDRQAVRAWRAACYAGGESRAALAAKVRRAIASARLTEKQREALKYAMEGLSQRDAAARCGISIGAYTGRLKSARAAVQAALASMEAPAEAVEA